MARVFTSFAFEDNDLRHLLSGQEKNSSNDIEFTGYSVQYPWDSSWKINCRARIKSCRGVIGIITKNTPNADGQIWELKCAVAEALPLLLIHGHPEPADRLTVLPAPIRRNKIHGWTHTIVARFLDSL